MKKKLKAARVIAESIATDLFTTGFGDEASRLVLLNSDGNDIGGWCKSAVVDRIVVILAAWNRRRGK